MEFEHNGRRYTWVLGRKTRVKETLRLPDILPEVWFRFMNKDDRHKLYVDWIQNKKPKIEEAERRRKDNGIDLIYDDSDLDRTMTSLSSGETNKFETLLFYLMEDQLCSKALTYSKMLRPLPSTKVTRR